MSHEISIRANGKAEMAYVGETPWHGLGQSLTQGASIEEWTAAAGMDWKVLRSIVRYVTDRPEAGQATVYRKMADTHVLFRSDNKAPLGVVSDKYQIVQPQAVLEFFRDLVESMGMYLETAGVLFDGRRFWAMANTGMAKIVGQGDTVKRNLLLSTSCDGSMATEGRYTDVRVVCNNTLTSARYGSPKVRITHRTKFNADEVRKEMGVDTAQERFAKTMDDMRRLADMPVSNVGVLAQTAELFSPGATKLAEKELMKIIRSKPVQRVAELAIEGKAIGSTLDGVAGSQWGWLNAVTQYVDHEARARTIDNRLNSAWFGKGSDLKEKAYEMALTGGDGLAQTVGLEYAPSPAEGDNDFARLLAR
jgi:phage/plasmid-like protein (TIGR03299 family)